MNIEKLLRDSEQFTLRREHKLFNSWILFVESNRLIAHNRCIYCNKKVQVNTNPMPKTVDHLRERANVLEALMI